LAQESGSADPDGTLDQQLLDDLGDDLLEGLDDIPVDPAFGEGDVDRPKSDRDLRDQDLREALGEGEDIGQAEEDELTRIARQMRQAQRRIEQREVSTETQEIQKNIVAQLDALIQELQEQKKKCNSSSASKPTAGSQQIKQPDQPNQGQQQTSNKPASDSSPRLGEEDAVAADAAAMEALIKQVWGHLPDRARQEMQNATVEDFLPKYQQVIEDYYRRLAAEPNR
jgi:TolA-binding protein